MNLRPIGLQPIALPLSYGPWMCGIVILMARFYMIRCEPHNIVFNIVLGKKYKILESFKEINDFDYPDDAL